MKTEQEQIEEMRRTIYNTRSKVNGIATAGDIAEALVQAGYADVSEYKAEIERLRQEVRDTDKMARNIIEQCKNNYDNAFERLKAQEREIEQLKAENCELTKKLEARLTCDFVKTAQKQAQIDVLNKAKERLDSAPNGWAYTTYIDELIEEVENGEDKG